eukprot:m.74747 g.74747  ORF g.74747 m.74747 type:complete len:67 (+) comp8067_c0_seq1:854-1054(+)
MHSHAPGRIQPDRRSMPLLCRASMGSEHGWSSKLRLQLGYPCLELLLPLLRLLQLLGHLTSLRLGI